MILDLGIDWLFTATAAAIVSKEALSFQRHYVCRPCLFLGVLPRRYYNSASTVRLLIFRVYPIQRISALESVSKK